jgi:hypothetical protein
MHSTVLLWARQIELACLLLWRATWSAIPSISSTPEWPAGPSNVLSSIDFFTREQRSEGRAAQYGLVLAI